MTVWLLFRHGITVPHLRNYISPSLKYGIILGIITHCVAHALKTQGMMAEIILLIVWIVALIRGDHGRK